MPPRRSHKKSRAGCLRCKQRKIKCDEVHPSCGNCKKHGVACDFDDPSVVTELKVFRRQSESSTLGHASITSPATPAAIQSTNSNSTPLLSDPVTTRLLELRLMHNYTAFTSKTLSSGLTPATVDAWEIAVPILAIDSPCLMDAVLAVSALHLRAQNPGDQTLIRAFHGYMASALSQYTATLAAGVNASNAEALFTTSALIAFQSQAVRRFQREDPEDIAGENGGYVLPLQWFHAFQGVKMIVFTSWKWIRGSDRVQPIIQAQPALALDLKSTRTAFFAFLLEGLDEQLESIEESRRAEIRQAYEHAVAFLNWSHHKPDRPRILGFPATCSRHFIDMIEQKDPRTLMILTCFFAMIKPVDDVWWLKDVAKKEVTGILTLVPVEWHPMADWAVQVVNHDGPMTEEIWGAPFQSQVSPIEQGFNTDVCTHIELLVQADPGLD